MQGILQVLDLFLLQRFNPSATLLDEHPLKKKAPGKKTKTSTALGRFTSKLNMFMKNSSTYDSQSDGDLILLHFQFNK